MKTAKEMFEELGYKIALEDEEYIVYKKILIWGSEFIEIIFDKKHKFLNMCTENVKKHQTITTILNMQELKAINKQVEELGW